MKIISILLLLASVLLNFKHGWDSFQPNPTPEQTKMMAELGITRTIAPYMGALVILIAILLLFPQTFFIGNLLNAISIVTIMALCLHSGNYKTALIEIPFLALPLVLIWLKYPFSFKA